jgi:hypothetical protein
MLAEARVRTAPPASWHGSAFGLRLASAFPIAGVASAPPGGDSAVWLEFAQARALRAAWPAAEATPMVDFRDQRGRPVMTIAAAPAVGYMFYGRGFGRFLADPDGLRVRCAPRRVAVWRWQRYVIGQVLPFVAVVRGLESIHASAVTVDGRAVAFVGRTQAGKSSTAVHLAARGAGFMADDVVTVQTTPEGVLAHPGMALASVRHPTVAALSAAERERLGTVVGRDAEGLRVAVHAEPQARRLAAVYFLDRRADAPRLDIESLSPVDPRLLLASSFNFVLRDDQRLARQLDVCAQISRTAAVYRVSIPEDVGTGRLADLIEAHLR